MIMKQISMLREKVKINEIRTKVLRGGKMTELFQTREGVSEYLASGPKIECLLCHKRFYSLGGHISKKHSITAMEYKEKFGLPRTKPLCTALVSGLYRDSLHRRKSLGDKSMLTLQERFTDKQLDNFRKQPRHSIPQYAQRELGVIAEAGRKAYKEKREAHKMQLLSSVDWDHF